MSNESLKKIIGEQMDEASKTRQQDIERSKRMLSKLGVIEAVEAIVDTANESKFNPLRDAMNKLAPHDYIGKYKYEVVSGPPGCIVSHKSRSDQSVAFGIFLKGTPSGAVYMNQLILSKLVRRPHGLAEAQYYIEDWGSGPEAVTEMAVDFLFNNGNKAHRKDVHFT